MSVCVCGLPKNKVYVDSQRKCVTTSWNLSCPVEGPAFLDSREPTCHGYRRTEAHCGNWNLPALTTRVH